MIWSENVYLKDELFAITSMEKSNQYSLLLPT